MSDELDNFKKRVISNAVNDYVTAYPIADGNGANFKKVQQSSLEYQINKNLEFKIDNDTGKIAAYNKASGRKYADKLGDASPLKTVLDNLSVDWCATKEDDRPKPLEGLTEKEAIEHLCSRNLSIAETSQGLRDIMKQYKK